ncbi:hypothetical protein [Flavobacterium granuli]|uniref:Uncharacterized protein n=1 Tax=Flavobacterium granuli TaxID=280093 RepID=A0A1M5MFT8_9FLAO|nr:hypothetical protein [Flavobacterium granuli]PRZ24944.1 hypothetical protein BC624_10314 [Flavobacterium granuli]SHG76238.1 hypothetical protein SAMN05443373_10413 [Flavobacterium granuli]
MILVLTRPTTSSPFLILRLAYDIRLMLPLHRMVEAELRFPKDLQHENWDLLFAPNIQVHHYKEYEVKFSINLLE